MKILAISASNVEFARNFSASTRACQEISDLIHEKFAPDADVEILPLLDYELNPCRMCGGCFNTLHCTRDAAFNIVLDKMANADAIFVVVPHYALIPSKIAMLLEKMQEMVYLRSCADESYRFVVAGKPTGIIAHGGMSEEALPYYEKNLLSPLANLFASVQMRIIGIDEEHKAGTVFGVKTLELPKGERFVTITHDWPVIRNRFEPLVEKVIAAV